MGYVPSPIEAVGNILGASNTLKGKIWIHSLLNMIIFAIVL